MLRFFHRLGFLEREDIRIHRLMLFTLLVILVRGGQRHLGASSKFVGIVRNVVRTIDVDGTRFIGQVEVAILGVDRTTDRARQFIVCAVVRSSDKLSHGLGGGILIIRCRTTAIRLTIQTVDIAGTLADSLRRVALVIHDRTIHDHFVSRLHFLVTRTPFPVVQIIGLEGLEYIGRSFGVHHIERGISVGSTTLESRFHRRNASLDIDALVALDIRSESLYELDGARDAEGAFQRAVAHLDLTAGTGLGHLQSGLGKADGEDYLAFAVVGLVFSDGDRDGLRFRGSLTAGHIQGYPVRIALDGPVAGGGQFHGLGTLRFAKSQFDGTDSNFGRSQVLLLLLASGKDRGTGKESHEEMSDFHSIQF